MGNKRKQFKRIPDNLDYIQRKNKVPGAYIIVDKNTNNTYVGSTGDLIIRKGKHEALLNNNQHHNRNLQKAFNEGADLEFTGVDLPDRETAYDFEQEFIDEFLVSNKLFNIAVNARDGATGLPITEETREKMRQAQLGKKRSPESIAKAVLKNTGLKRSDEFREKMSKIRTGMKPSEETIQKLVDSHLGYIMPQEQKDKISASNKGKIVTEEHRRNLSIALTGKKASAETIEKMRIASTGRKHSDETKEKNRIASTGRVMSKEEIERSREARTGQKRTEEQIQNLKNSPASLSRAKAVIADGIEYFSIGEAARAHNVVYTTVTSRIDSPNFPGWYFKEST